MDMLLGRRKCLICLALIADGLEFPEAARQENVRFRVPIACGTVHNRFGKRTNSESYTLNAGRSTTFTMGVAVTVIRISYIESIRADKRHSPRPIFYFLGNQVQNAWTKLVSLAAQVRVNVVGTFRDASPG